MPRTGPTHTTGGHPRWVMVKRRKRGSNVTFDQQTPNTQQQQQQPQEQKNTLNILQINISGLSTSIVNLAHTLHKKDVHIALVQETQHKNTSTHITGYTPYPCSCTDCQGTITYIRNDQQATVERIDLAHPACIQKATLWKSGTKFNVYNAYNPPGTN